MDMDDRKKAHIDLAFESQTVKELLDQRFYYEPILSKHPQALEPFSFMGKTWRTPIWVSSMTGGTEKAAKINRNLAAACKEFGMGMGLGSCRVLLDGDTFFDDFNVRKYIGYELPFYANLGIAQIEKIVQEENYAAVFNLLDRLQADGLIIHVNPMQEWFQIEGDRLAQAPLITIKTFQEHFKGKLIVKEVGQGMGPDSLRHLMALPLEAIEFGAFGGTNFAKVELLRNPGQENQLLESLTQIGNDAAVMLNSINDLMKNDGSAIKCKQLIISGGIKNFLDGYYYTSCSLLPSVFGMASTLLKYAQDDYNKLCEFIQVQIRGLELANAYLTIRT
jgi:isopentenyl-diphosphate delta-isomerase